MVSIRGGDRAAVGAGLAQLEAELAEAYAKADWTEYEGYPLFRAVNRMNAYNIYLSIQQEAQ